MLVLYFAPRSALWADLKSNVLFMLLPSPPPSPLELLARSLAPLHPSLSRKSRPLSERKRANARDTLLRTLTESLFNGGRRMLTTAMTPSLFAPSKIRPLSRLDKMPFRRGQAGVLGVRAPSGREKFARQKYLYFLRFCLPVERIDKRTLCGFGAWPSCQPARRSHKNGLQKRGINEYDLSGS